MADYTETITNEVARPTRVVKTTKVDTGVKTEHPQKVYEKKKAIFRTYQVIWYILGVIEVLLVFRFVFKALGANPFSGFASFIYSVSAPLAVPFQGILRTNAVEGSVFEWSTVIAGIVYALIASGLVQLLQILKPVTPDEVEETVDSQ